MKPNRKNVRRRAPRARRRGEPSADPYREQSPPRGPAQCAQCGARYRNKRWTLPPPAAPRPKRARLAPLSVLCPACRKTHDRYANGIVTIQWPTDDVERHTILNLIHNQEAWGRQVNPLERIISIESTDRRLTVLTTNERLAQRIGRALERAFHGKATYDWSRGNKLLRVAWSRESSTAAR